MFEGADKMWGEVKQMAMPDRELECMDKDNVVKLLNLRSFDLI